MDGHRCDAFSAGIDGFLIFNDTGKVLTAENSLEAGSPVFSKCGICENKLEHSSVKSVS